MTQVLACATLNQIEDVGLFKEEKGRRTGSNAQ